jgi:hypothetical protein
LSTAGGDASGHSEVKRQAAIISTLGIGDPQDQTWVFA